MLITLEIVRYCAFVAVPNSSTGVVFLQPGLGFFKTGQRLLVHRIRFFLQPDKALRSQRFVAKPQRPGSARHDSGVLAESLVDSLLLLTRLVANAAQYLLEGLMPGFPAGLFLLLLVALGLNGQRPGGPDDGVKQQKGGCQGHGAAQRTGATDLFHDGLPQRRSFSECWFHGRIPRIARSSSSRNALASA